MENQTTNANRCNRILTEISETVIKELISCYPPENFVIVFWFRLQLEYALEYCDDKIYLARL